MSPIIQSLANGSARGYGAFVPAGAATAFESIASATGTGSSGTITFSSIPQTYQHLQIRFIFATATAGQNLAVRMNSDSGSNYAYHFYGSNGSATFRGAASSMTEIKLSNFQQGSDTAYPTGGIIDIYDYASTAKTKVLRAFTGIDKNSAGDVALSSGLWNSTSAITRLDFITTITAFKTISTISLYGIKGA